MILSKNTMNSLINRDKINKVKKFNLVFNYNYLKECFNDKNIFFLKKKINKSNFKFKYLNKKETNLTFLEIKKFLKKKFVKSGIKRKIIWEKGWKENLDNFKRNLKTDNLIPLYYKKGRSVMRFKHKYFLPEDELFEYKISKFVLEYISRKYLFNIKNIYEFGCGPAHNLLNIAIYLKKKSRNFFGFDWVKSSGEIIKIIEKNKQKLKVDKHNFFYNRMNMLKKTKKIFLKKNSACITFGSMEQLGSNFINFYNLMYRSTFQIYINIEPLDNLYNLGYKSDFLCYKHHLKRGYLKNYLKFLKQEEKEKKIKIIKIQKILGSKMNDGWSLVIWKKNNNFNFTRH